MAANRTDPAPAAEEASGAAKSEAPATPAASGGIKSWLPLIITVVAMPVLAYGMTSFVLLPHLQKGLGITAAPAEKTEASKGGHGSGAKKSEASGKKTSVTMNKLLVNVAGTMGARYLLVSINIVGSGENFAAKIEEHDPQLRDMAGGTLSTKTLTDLEKPGARNLIRTELISGFNNILGDSLIQDIFLTEFAIQ